MIHFSGVFQLAGISKETETRNGDKKVYFSAFSRRGDQSDKVFCEVYGKTAEYLMRNLTKKSDGKYISRKLYLAGSVETYKATKTETLPGPPLYPDMLEAQYGVLKVPLTLSFVREVQEEKFIFRVSYLEFEDKKKESERLEVHIAGSTADVVPLNKHKTEDTGVQPKQTSSLTKDFTETLNKLKSPEIGDTI